MLRFWPAAFAALTMALPAWADNPVFTLSIKDHRFQPDKVTIPANQKVRLIVNNLDATPAEFESYELHREKVVSGNDRINVFVGPLDPGTYPFFDDFHKDTTTGMLIAK